MSYITYLKLTGSRQGLISAKCSINISKKNSIHFWRYSSILISIPCSGDFLYAKIFYSTVTMFHGWQWRVIHYIYNSLDLVDDYTSRDTERADANSSNKLKSKGQSRITLLLRSIINQAVNIEILCL